MNNNNFITESKEIALYCYDEWEEVELIENGNYSLILIKVIKMGC